MRTGEYEGQLGMDAALERAGEAWEKKARHWVKIFARLGIGFTSDDIREVCPPPATPNAWGALFKACADEGWITDIGTTRSTRPDAHGRKVTRWRGVEA